MHESSTYYVSAAVNSYALGDVQACKHYHAMLAKVYGPELVLEPYVMSVDALDEQDTSGRASCTLPIGNPSADVISLLCRLLSHLTYRLAKKGKHADYMCVKVFTVRLLDM